MKQGVIWQAIVKNVVQKVEVWIRNYIIVISVEIIDQICMQNQERHYKVKQEQRDSNPIYRIVSNKIKNINKKLTQLNQLQSSDKKPLTAPQLAKLAKRQELTHQLNKQQDFLDYYKQLVVENNLVYDRVDDLIKISALLTVGKRIDQQKYCPDQTKTLYQEIYNEIFAKSAYNGKNQLSDQVVRIYRLLQTYLDKNHYYSQCKDYMTYLKEIDLRRPNTHSTQPQPSLVMQHVHKINELIKGKEGLGNQVNLEKKNKNLVIINDVVHFKQENSKLAQKIEEIKNQVKNSQLEKELIEAYPVLQKASESESTLPDLEERRKDSYTQALCEGLLKGQEEQNSADFSKKRQERENNSEEKVKQSTSNKRKRKNKKNNYVDLFQVDNMRKCSEIILEATPEASKNKKIRYVEKVQ